MPLSPNLPAEEWIHHFVYSDNPKFKGKSKTKRIKMALGAYYSAKHKGTGKKENLLLIPADVLLEILENQDLFNSFIKEEEDLIKGSPCTTKEGTPGIIQMKFGKLVCVAV